MTQTAAVSGTSSHPLRILLTGAFGTSKRFENCCGPVIASAASICPRPARRPWPPSSATPRRSPGAICAVVMTWPAPSPTGTP